ncbi:MAG: hypothetical protein JKY13_00515 [Gammaproteobacteria bacterium]|nr:hypothetical protein [Gammaproteobacteria bacterium]
MKTLHAALIATGDELIQGDIINTTGPAIARQLIEHGFVINKQMTVADDRPTICQAIQTALIDNDVIFLTGGLGPTSDDLTRFALADAIEQKLIFDPVSWQAIVDRLSSVTLEIDESNRQQAYFPENATIFPNPQGTAAGCMLNYQQKKIFMLPGPPHECLPMLENYALAQLPQHRKQPKLHWLLLDCSEGEIAKKLDNTLQHLDCHTGYRADYPYLEFKVWANNEKILQQCAQLATPIIEEFLISKENIPASEKLQENLSNAKKMLVICDQATGGLLKATLLKPNTIEKLQFVGESEQADIIITGLAEYWQGNSPPAQTTVRISISGKQQTKSVYFFRDNVRHLAVEWACQQINVFFEKNF